VLKVNLILLQLNDNRQHLDDTQKFDDGVMPIGGRDGKQKHLLQEALPIFIQEGAYMI
jgi:hypothetical protein